MLISQRVTYIIIISISIYHLVIYTVAIGIQYHHPVIGKPSIEYGISMMVYVAGFVDLFPLSGLTI